MGKESSDLDKKRGGGVSRRDFLKTALGLTLNLAALEFKQNTAAQEVNQESPFNYEVQKEVLAAVAKEMKINLKAEIPAPVVIRAESVTDEAFSKAMGFDAGNKHNNLFVPPNTILLVDNSRIHNLAHELVHYFQHNYKGGIREDPWDMAEAEAVAVQDKFRKFKSKN